MILSSVTFLTNQPLSSLGWDDGVSLLPLGFDSGVEVALKGDAGIAASTVDLAAFSLSLKVLLTAASSSGSGSGSLYLSSQA